MFFAEGRPACVEKIFEDRARKNTPKGDQKLATVESQPQVVQFVCSMSSRLQMICTGVMSGRERDIREARNPRRLFQRVIVG